MTKRRAALRELEPGEVAGVTIEHIIKLLAAEAKKIERAARTGCSAHEYGWPPDSARAVATHVHMYVEGLKVSQGGGR